MLHLLLQIEPGRKRTAAETFQEMLPWLAVLFAIILIGGFILIYLRKRLDKKDEAASGDVGFTLADLRKLRDRGELSAEEFEVARNRMVQKVKENLDRRTEELRKRNKQEPNESV